MISYRTTVVLLTVLAVADGLSFYLKARSKKCFREEIRKGQLVAGEYKVSEIDLKTHITVTDTNGHILFKKLDAHKGKFSFTSDDYDLFEICVETEGIADSGDTVEVQIAIRVDADAKNANELGKVEKLKPIELEMTRLKDLADTLVSDFAYLKSREEAMRDTNESTAARVLYFSVVSMLSLVVLAAWQVYYLRSYFVSKKLIDG